MNWHATHEIPPPGLAAYPEPDPALTPTAELQAGLRLHAVEERGAWTKVRADNGWEGWVDGRRLVPVSTAPTVPEVAETPGVPPTSAAPAGAPAQPLGGLSSPGFPPPQPQAGGSIPAGFAPDVAATSPAASSSISPMAIGAAVAAAVLIIGFLLPWVTLDDRSQNAFRLAGDGWSVRSSIEGRTTIGVYLLQLVWVASVLGAAATVLVFIRHQTAKVVAIAAGVVGLLTVLGRLLLDLQNDSATGFGVWLSLLAAIGLVAVGFMASTGKSEASTTGGW